MTLSSDMLSWLLLVVFIVPFTNDFFGIGLVSGLFYPAERDALLEFRESMTSVVDLHRIWTGPPCYGNQTRWFGVTCSNWHVVGLDLEGIQLTGVLLPAFLHNITFLTTLSLNNNSIFGSLPNLTNLVSLQHVFLSNNRFTGPIPSDYIQLPRLKTLELQQNYLDGQIPPLNQSTLTDFNVSYNSLDGPIPPTRALRRFPSSSYEHNSGLCGSPLDTTCPGPPPSPAPVPPPAKEKNKKSLQTWTVALIAVSAALVPLLVVLVSLCYYKKMHGKGKPKEEQTGEGISAVVSENKIQNSWSTEDPERVVELQFFNNNIPVFDLDDLLRASAEVLGKGKLGSSYKATLESGAVVAVKRVKNMNTLTKKEFIQQMQLLGKMKHENLVQIVSFYYSGEEKLIISEFVPHGSLFDLLHDNRGVGRIPLAWTTRLCIMKDIAKGLAFLHQFLPTHKVPHGNLKSPNVLVHRNNGTYHSRLTDFGFLPLLPSRKACERLAIGRSPEFSQGKKLTHKTDVYCFGIILLEIITGRIPGELTTFGNEETKSDDLSDWVRTVVNNDWSTDILDVEILATREGHNEMLKLTELALECTDMTPEKRPKMSEVMRRIEEIDRRNNESEIENLSQ